MYPCDFSVLCPKCGFIGGVTLNLDSLYDTLPERVQNETKEEVRKLIQEKHNQHSKSRGRFPCTPENLEIDALSPLELALDLAHSVDE